MSNDYRAEIDISVKGVDSITAAQKATTDLEASLLKAAESAQKLDSSLKNTAKGASEMGKSSAKITAGLNQTGDAADAVGAKAKKSGDDMDAAWRKQHDSLSNTRYALYDVAAMYGTVSVAATAVSAATVGVAASYEKSFANVARTTMATGEELEKIRTELVGLSQVTPISYEDITAVASLGAQLGIANDNLSSFTSTVTMFAASTDVTVERTAMGLGRIAQLTGTAGSEIDNLADSIYYTGINAVATEGQILSVAEQIATAGNLSGLANHEVIALASALASLGVAPEAARGSIMRVFANIEKAATQGGESLQKFASISGTSAEHIQENWGTNTQQVFTEFIEGLGRLSDAGESTNQILADVGIYQVRDVKALQLLLNNMGVYLTAQEDTAQAYKENTALSEGFAIQTDTLVDALARLKNNFMAITSEGSGFTDVLKGAIDVLNRVLSVVANIAQHPLGKYFVGAAGAIAVAVSAWASFHVAVNLARGGLAAFATAQAGLMKSNVNLKIGLVQVTRELFALATGGEAATRSLLTTGSAIDRTVSASTRAKGMAAGIGSSLASLAKGGLIMGGVTLAVMGAAKAWDAYSTSQMTAGQKAEKYFGDLSGLSEAIAKDTAAGDDSLKSLSTTLDTTAKAAKDFSSEVTLTADGQYVLKDATDEAAGALENQIMLMGELSRQAIAQIISDTVKDDWAEYGATLRNVGFDIDEYMSKAMLMDGSAEAYAQGFKASTESLNEMENALSQAATQAQADFDLLTISADVPAEAFSKAADKVEETSTAYSNFLLKIRPEVEGTNKAIDNFVKSSEQISPAAEQAANDALLLGASAKAAGVDIRNAGDDAEYTEGEIDNLSKAVQEFLNVSSTDLKLADLFFGLGESLHKNGLEFNLFTQEGISNMQALEGAINQLAASAGEDTDLFTANVLGLMEGLQAQGVVVGDELTWVYELLNQVSGNQYGIDFSTQAARTNVHAFINDLIAAQQQIMALNNVSGIWNTDQSSDATAKMAQAYREAEAKVESLRAVQNKLNTATDVTNNQVSNIARGYDTAAKNANKTSKGAGKTAKNTKDAAKAAKDLAKEMRTSNDYARDLAGVFGDINDLVFGMTNATGKVRENFQSLLEDLTKDASDVRLDLFGFDRKAAMDGILSTFYNLKQAAEDAKKEVRDSLQAVQDAQAKLQSNKAEGQTLEYQLMVAKALGSAERIAEIEAKIAENQADRVEATNAVADALERQRKAQEATSTGTGGSGEVDISNRDKLRKLASEYMDYADLLRSAGVSTKDVGKYTKQAEKDFLAQGKALGFTDSQLEVYMEGIRKSSGEIGKNSTSLKGNEKALEDLYRSHVDAVTAFAATGATQKQVTEFAKQSEKQFMSQARQLGFNTAELGKYRTAWDGLHKTIAALPSEVTIRSNVQNPSDAALKKFFTEWNNKQLNMKTSVNANDANNWKKANTGGRGVSAPINVPVRAQTNNADFAKAARGMKLLMELQRDYANIQSYMRNPIGNFSKIASTIVGATTRVSKLSSGNFWRGGFTGRGNKFDPAGTVHKGEYVFTQEEVDQSTGQPKPEALYAMLGKTLGLNQPSVSAEAIAYKPQASNSNALTLVEWMPSQMHQLAQLVGQYAPKPRGIADTALGVNKINEARTGRGQG